MKVERCWRSVVYDVEILELCRAALLLLWPVPRGCGGGVREWVLSYCHVGSGNQTWVVLLAFEHLYMISPPHFAFFLFKTWFFIGTATWGSLCGRRGWHWCWASCPSWVARGLRTRLVWFCRYTRPPMLPPTSGRAVKCLWWVFTTPPMGVTSSWPFSGPRVGSAAAGAGRHSGLCRTLHNCISCP